MRLPERSWSDMIDLSFCKFSGVRLCTLSGALCQYGSIGETHGTDPKRLALDRPSIASPIRFICDLRGRLLQAPRSDLPRCIVKRRNQDQHMPPAQSGGTRINVKVVRDAQIMTAHPTNHDGIEPK